MRKIRDRPRSKHGDQDLENRQEDLGTEEKRGTIENCGQRLGMQIENNNVHKEKHVFHVK